MKQFFLLAALATATTGASAAASTSTQAIDEARPLFQKGDYSGAQKLTEQALLLAKTPEEKVDALLHLGLTYKERKLYPQARKQWSKALQVPGASAQNKLAVQSVIAASYGEEENWNSAAIEFQKIVDAPEATAQDKATARFAIAAALIAQKKDAEARSQLSTLAEDTTLDAGFRLLAYTNLGQNLINAGQFTQARSAFTSAHNLPGIPAELLIITQAGIAETFKREGNAAQAQAEFFKAQVESIRQGQLCSERKQFSQARTFFEQSLTFGTVAPTLDAGMRAQIAYLLLAEGKPAEARTRLEELVAKAYGPGLSVQDEAMVLSVKQSAQLSIAQSFVQEGNKAQAQKVLQTLLETEHLNPNVQNGARTLLKTLS